MKRIVRIVLSCACVVALTSCQRETSDPAALETDNGVAEPLPDADINASLEALGPPPDDVEDLNFIGRWAVDESSCASAGWQFTRSELETPAESVCRFLDIRAVAGGYDISARCTAEAPEEDDVLRLRFAESDRRMRFQSQSIADATLRACAD